MKLRNKKTGEIVEAESCNSATGMIGIYYEDKDGQVGTKDCFETLSELNEEWEDYKPVGPIEDNKMRQCVKLWTEVNRFEGELLYAEREDWCSFYEEDEQEELLFRNKKCPNLKDGERYTIAELCGEEKE